MHDAAHRKRSCPEAVDWQVPLNRIFGKIIHGGSQLLAPGGGVRHWPGSAAGIGPGGYGFNFGAILVFPKWKSRPFEIAGETQREVSDVGGRSGVARLPVAYVPIECQSGVRSNEESCVS